MRSETRPIEFTNGCAHFYGKKKVDMNIRSQIWGKADIKHIWDLSYLSRAMKETPRSSTIFLG